jgi:hypothetical protein
VTDPRPLRDESPPTASHAHATLTLSRRCFGDEIAIDFPSLGVVVDRVRDHFVVFDEGLAAESAEVVVTERQARAGAIVPLGLILRGLCPDCGGRGESWSERCNHCAGSGERDMPHHFRFAVPAGIVDGTRFRFVVAPPQTRPTRVDVTVSIA